MNQFATKMKDMLWSFKQNRKAQIVALCIILFIIIAAIVGFVVFGREKDVNETSQTTSSINRRLQEIPKEPQRAIDGVLAKKGEENIYPTAVIIENLVSVRPQLGLKEANVIYETLAEGGITRFMAFYANKDAPIEKIGPVRSARPYFVDIAEEYKAVLAHAGGSPQSLEELRNSKKVVSLNQIGGDHEYFWRDTKGIGAPHNLFTSSALLELAHRDKNISSTGDYIPWKFQQEAKTSERTAGEAEIRINFSSYSYNVRYVYKPDTNTYLRFHSDEPHTDATTKEQLTAKNIIVQIAPTSLLERNTGRLAIETTGKGKAFLFLDGKKIDGTWEKKKDEDRTFFYDNEGKEITLNAGQTWIEIVPPDRDVLYDAKEKRN